MSSSDFDLFMRWSQVVSIPSLCPHGVNNPGDEAVLIAYTYLPGWVLVLLATNHFHFVPQVQLYQTGAPTQMAVSWRSLTKMTHQGGGYVCSRNQQSNFSAILKHKVLKNLPFLSILINIFLFSFEIIQLYCSNLINTCYQYPMA